jgi:hypothetical protein
MNENLYVINNMMCCVPLKATLRTLGCAQRYRMANTQRLPMATVHEEYNELDVSPCRSCPTGAENAGVHMPVTARDLVKARSGLDHRKCLKCKAEFQPTCRTHRWCPPCGKVRKRDLARISEVAKREKKRAQREA